MEHSREALMGKLASRFTRFPLLLKFLDAQTMLSVQVHPSDAHPELIPAGDTAKTEAWVVIEAEKDSQIYAGLKSGTTEKILRSSLEDETIADHLVCIHPKPGDAVFIPAGTVHTLGDGVVVFEVQQNSDVTFRLYDWGHIDPRTKASRPLQVDHALPASISERAMLAWLQRAWRRARRGAREALRLSCIPLVSIDRPRPFPVGATAEPRVLVCIAGSGQVTHNQIPYSVAREMFGCCRRRPEYARFNPAERQPCWR